MAAAWALTPSAAPAQVPSLDSLVARLASMSAVTGFEDTMAESLLSALPEARLDRDGNVVWTRGSRPAVRVAICPMDEVGYVVGNVTPDGYLRLRRVGATPVHPHLDRFLEGQRVTVFGGRGAVAGVVGVRSLHLRRSSPTPDEPFTLADAYLDVGAASASEVGELGIGLLAPVTRAKQVHRYGRDLVAAPNASARAACAALLSAIQRAEADLVDGSGGISESDQERDAETAVAAFARRRHFAHDGAAFFLTSRDVVAASTEVVLLGEPANADSLGAGAVVSRPDSVPVSGRNEHVTSWALPTRYAGTPVETVSMRDVAVLRDRLVRFMAGR